jgi:hypothetical protein
MSTNNERLPDWLTAPEWAMWFAVDEDGRALWFQSKPVLRTPSSVRWHNLSGYACTSVPGTFHADNWRDSLEARPPVPTPSSAVPVAYITHSADELSRMEMTIEGLSLGPGKHPLYASTPVPDEAVRRLVEAARAIESSPSLDDMVFMSSRPALCIALNALRTALAHPALRAFIGSEK